MTKELITAKYETRDFTDYRPTALEAKGIQQSQKYEKHSAVYKMTEDLKTLEYYIQIIYHATDYNSKLQSIIRKVIMNLSQLCNTMYTTLTVCKISAPNLSSLDSKSKSETLEKFTTILHQLNTKSMVDKSYNAISDLDKVIEHLPTYKPQISMQLCTSNKLLACSNIIELNGKIIGMNLEFYLENCDKILDYHKKQIENLRKKSHDLLLQSQSECEHEKVKIKKSFTSDEEARRQRLINLYFENEQKYNALMKQLPEALRLNKQKFEERMHNNQKDYDRQVKKNEIDYQNLLEQNHKTFNIQHEHYESEFIRRKTQLEKYLAEKIHQNEELLETKLQQNENNLEQRLEAINQSYFRKKSKRQNAENAKRDEDNRLKAEKHNADDEVRKEVQVKITAASQEKEQAISDASQLKANLDKAAYEIYQTEFGKADQIKKDNDIQAEKDKIEADNLAKEKHKKLEKIAKQEKQAAYQQMQEESERDIKKITSKQKRMSVDIERSSELKQTEYKQKERELVGNLQKFELEIILQAVKFQRNQGRSAPIHTKILYYKSLEFCFNKVYDALNFVKAILTTIKYFWKALHDITSGTDLLGSRIAKHTEIIKVLSQETTKSESGGPLQLRKLQLRQQRGHYEDEMDELYTNFTKCFGVTTIAAIAFADICKFFDSFKI